MYYFESLTGSDYSLIFKYVLGFYILFGLLILRALESRATAFRINDRNWLILFCAFIIFFSGTRGLRVGTDTINYYNFFYLRGISIGSANIFYFFEHFQSDFLFEVIMYISFIFKDFHVFLLVVSAIMNITLYTFVRKFTDYGRTGSSLLLFLTFASSFIFLSHQLNTIRNGVSIPFVLLGIYYVTRRQNVKSVLFLVIAFFLHRTALIPIACIVIALLGERVEFKYFIILYVLFIVASYAGFGLNNLPFLQGLSDEGDLSKLSFKGETTYRVGFRLDFVLYNSFFLFIFYKFSDLKDRTDLFLIKYFILASIVFFLNFNIPFSDRIGAYSWVIIPLVLYNTVKNSFPNKKLYISSMVTLSYFVLNYLILFP